MYQHRDQHCDLDRAARNRPGHCRGTAVARHGEQQVLPEHQHYHHRGSFSGQRADGDDALAQYTPLAWNATWPDCRPAARPNWAALGEGNHARQHHRYRDVEKGHDPQRREILEGRLVEDAWLPRPWWPMSNPINAKNTIDAPASTPYHP